MKLRYYIPSLVLFLLPLQLGTFFFFDFSLVEGIRTDYLAPALYLTDLVSLVAIVVFWQHVLKLFLWRPVLISLGLLLIPVVFAMEPWIAAYRYIKIVEFLAMVGIFSQLKWGGRELVAIAGATTVQFGLALAQLVQRSTLQGVFYWLGERAISVTTPDAAVAALDGNLFLRPYGSFSHPNALGGFFLLVYFFVLAVPAFRKMPQLRAVTLFLATLLVLLSFSKVVIATFVVLNLLIFMQAIVGMKCRLCGIARAVVLLVVAAVFILPQGDPLTVTKRVFLVDSALNIILWKPWAGTGLGNYLYAQALYPNPFTSYFLQPVHNIVLLFVSESGLLVGGIVLWSIGRFLQTYLTSFPFFLCVLAVLLTGMLDHYWITAQQNLLLLAVVVGGMTATQNNPGPRSSSML